MEERTCYNCGDTMPLSQYYRHHKFKDGRKTTCKVCENEQRDVRNAIHKPWRNEIQRKSHVNRNKRYKEEWKTWFKTVYGEHPRCEVCDRELLWYKGEGGPCVQFDHKNGNNHVITKHPSNWYYTHICSKKNQTTWLNEGFGILCQSCNGVLPSDLDERDKLIRRLNDYGKRK